MATAQPTVIALSTISFDVNADPTKVDFTFEFEMLFVPDASAPKKRQQHTLTLDAAFTKQDVRSAAQQRIIDSVAAEGATINASRIFNVDSLLG